MIFLVVLFFGLIIGVVLVIVFATGLISWAIEHFNMEVDKFFDRPIEKAFSLFREKETDEIRLLVFQIKNRGELSLRGKFYCDKIFQSGKDTIPFYELRGNNMIVFLFSLDSKNEFLIEAVRLSVPEELMSRARKLFWASIILRNMFSMFFKIGVGIKEP